MLCIIGLFTKTPARQEGNLLPKRLLDSLYIPEGREQVCTGAESIFLSLLLVSEAGWLLKKKQKNLPIVKNQVRAEPRPSPSNYNSQHAARPKSTHAHRRGRGNQQHRQRVRVFGGRRWAGGSGNSLKWRHRGAWAPRRAI